ncbi:helix-turn-helix domain-containing protein [Jiella marina]|uniref:helix-turn-helix domain-containing protein n=1 Tax=Jiella sp. LLJ827 TaxID=2917712 RepID=UPI002101A2F5|nr:helix-turn-helix domain-containing protein [Jiella sp. LLJ827]MCQ0988836.1 hypothetical protein [Jiella sp. LLJ827]
MQTLIEEVHESRSARPSRASSPDFRSHPSGRSRGQRPAAEVHAATACRMAQEIVCAFFEVPIAEIRRPNRAISPVCDARHVAMYLANVVFQISLSRMAASFGRDRTSIAHAVRRVEDRRDDAEFDALLCRLEVLARAVRLGMSASAKAGVVGEEGQ